MPDNAGVFTRTDGTFTGATVWTQEKAAANLVTAAHFDTHDQDIANALNNRVFKDGTTTNVTNLLLTATVNSATGVINFGSVNFASMYGTNNVFIGGAGNFALTGTQNVGLGASALLGLTSGGTNTAIGLSALAGVGSGVGNTGIGANAIAIGTGSSNSGFGAGSLLRSTSGANNTGCGFNAGQFVTTGSNNSFLGQAAGNTVSTGGRNIVIGAGCDVPSASNSGQISIGNLIYATNAIQTGTNVSVGLVGIGKTTPAYALDVVGDIAANQIGNGFKVAEGTNGKQGVVTLVAGTKVVNVASISATSRIQLTTQSLGTVTTPKAIAVTARTAGTSFTITSADNTDTSVVAYSIFEPA